MVTRITDLFPHIDEERFHLLWRPAQSSGKDRHRDRLDDVIPISCHQRADFLKPLSGVAGVCQCAILRFYDPLKASPP